MENTKTNSRDYRLAIGFLAGAAAGVGLAMWLAPRVRSEARQRVAEAIRGARARAADRFQEASAKVDEVMDELTKKGQSLRDEAADTVARGAREVERRATAARTERSS